MSYNKLWTDMKSFSQKHNIPIRIVRGRPGVNQNTTNAEFTRIKNVHKAQNYKKAFTGLKSLGSKIVSGIKQIPSIISKGYKKAKDIHSRIPKTTPLLEVLQTINDAVLFLEYPISVELIKKDKSLLKLYFQTQNDFHSFIEQLDNAASMTPTEEILSYSYKKSAQREKKRIIQRSKKGRGNDLQNCNVVDNDLIYIPQSGMCLYRCLIYLFGTEKISLEKLEEYGRSKGIIRHNFRQCDLPKISKLFGISINYYRQSTKEMRYPTVPNQIYIGLLDDHYFVIKDQSCPTACFKQAKKELVWINKKLSDTSLESKQQNVKFHICEQKEMYKDCYIFDLETYKNWDLWFEPYACGFASLQNITASKFDRRNVMIKNGKDCIMEMLTVIDKLTKKRKITVELNKQDNAPFKTKSKQFSIKSDVFLFAHNSACFDTYFFLQLEGVKMTRMIQKGGIMSIKLISDKFQNANFIIKDTMKFIMGSLPQLCTSYKVPTELSKQSMKHNNITEFNFLQKKAEWFEYLQNDVLSLSFIFSSFITKMRQIMGDVDIKQYCSIAQLAYSYLVQKSGIQQKYFTDPVVRNFVQRANRGGRVFARIQEFKTKNIDQILQLNGVKCIDDLVGKVLNNDTIKLIGDDYQIAFDATSLYPSAMSLQDASYLDPTSTIVLTEQQCFEMLDSNCPLRQKKFIIECDLFIPKDLQFVPISIKLSDNHAQFSTGYYEKVCLNDVDLNECFRFGIKLEKVYEGIYSEPMENYMREFVLELFAERKLVKDTDEILGNLYKLILNSAYGKLGQKDCNTEIKFCNETRFFDRKYDDSVLDYFKLNNGDICYKKKKEITESQQQSPNHLAGYVLAYSKRIMNNFALKMGADKQNLIYYSDTDSFYIHSSVFNKFLSEIKDELGGGKNDYGKTKMIIQAHYIACKQKICYVLDTETMILSKSVTWKGIDKRKFKEIKQITVERVIAGGDSINMSQWSRSQQFGVRYGENNLNKKLSIEMYLKKMDLNNGIYQYQHLQKGHTLKQQ